MKLLAIPNDPITAYKGKEKDLVREFNPSLNEEPFFDEVSFLNFKQEEDRVLEGIKSYAILRNKEKFYEILKSLQRGERNFTFPLFRDVFMPEKEEILDLAKSFDPDILRSFMTPFSIELGIFLKQELEVPLVLSINDISRVTEAVKEADSIICISDVLKRKIIEQYRVDEERVALIPDAVDMEVFYPFSRERVRETIEPSFLDSKYKILSVSRVVRNKNLETLIKAVGHVRDELEDVTHIHVGSSKTFDSETEEHLRGIKKNLGLEETVYFLGEKPKKKLPYYYSWADVFALPTLWEGLGRSLIEALACGTPAITTNYEPMTEVVQDDYNGLTSDPLDSEMLASQIIRVLTDNDLSSRLRENARKSVFNKYNAKRIEYKCFEFYQNLLNKTPQPETR